MKSRLTPVMLVEPEGIDDEAQPSTEAAFEDPLLDLFRNKAALPAETFRLELQKQRQTPSLQGAAAQ